MKFPKILTIAVAVLLHTVAGAHAAPSAVSSFPSISVTATNYANELMVTNGAWIGGVRRTTWPSGGVADTIVKTGSAPAAGDVLTAADTTGTNGVWIPSIWQALPSATDMEGGTVYGAQVINTLQNGVVAYAVNYLTNLWGDYAFIFNAGIGTPDPIELAKKNGEILNLGDYSGAGMVLSNVFGLCNIISGAGMTGVNGHDIYNIGGWGAFQMQFDDYRNSFNIGIGTSSNSTYNAVTDAFAIGNMANADQAFTGKSHMFALGSYSVTTNTGDFVFGDNAYNYFFPGASTRFDNPIYAPNLIWTNLPTATDMEGGTVYGAQTLNPLADGVLSFSVNYLTNFNNDYGVSVSMGYGTPDAVTVGKNNVSMFNLGDYSGGNMSASNCLAIVNLIGGYGEALLDCSGIFSMGGYSSFLLAATNSVDIFNLMKGAGYQMTATDSGAILNLGSFSSSNSVYSASSGDILNIGLAANANRTFSGKTHMVALGSNAVTTNSNDFVVGDNQYNYFFPGASTRFISGAGSLGTGTITTSATGATNTLAANVILYVTGATGAALTDNAGTTEFSGVAIAGFTPVRLQPGGKFTGTSITYATGTASHAW